ncbi:far-red impaired response 1-like protein, partial [Sesbania bispinosa]
GLKKKEGHKGRKRLKGCVEKQPKMRKASSRTQSLNKKLEENNQPQVKYVSIKGVEVPESLAWMSHEEPTFNGSYDFQEETTLTSQLSNIDSENKV